MALLDVVTGVVFTVDAFSLSDSFLSLRVTQSSNILLFQHTILCTYTLCDRSTVNGKIFLLWPNRPSRPCARSLLTFLYHNTHTNTPIQLGVFTCNIGLDSSVNYYYYYYHHHHHHQHHHHHHHHSVIKTNATTVWTRMR